MVEVKNSWLFRYVFCENPFTCWFFSFVEDTKYTRLIQLPGYQVLAPPLSIKAQYANEPISWQVSSKSYKHSVRTLIYIRNTHLPQTLETLIYLILIHWNYVKSFENSFIAQQKRYFWALFFLSHYVVQWFFFMRVPFNYDRVYNNAGGLLYIYVCLSPSSTFTLVSARHFGWYGDEKVNEGQTNLEI